MNKTFNVCCALLALMVVLGISARPHGSAAMQPVADSTSVEQRAPESSVIDEVIWVVGDEPIMKSDVEMSHLQTEAEGIKFKRNPDFAIPEQIAVQKLFLHQAELDSVKVQESQVTANIERQINRWIEMAGGSVERLEQYRGQSIAQMRSQLRDDFRNNLLVQSMQEKLVEDVKVTPSDVRAYFKNLPEDSIPFVPTEVEVEIITRTPRILPEEINRVKDELRNYTERVTKGETTFATLARLYSEDPGSARQGGEMDYTGRGMLDPAFANVAFNLTDPKKISKIVETEFGFHIIQLVDKRGDKIKVRHILIKPKVTDEEVNKTLMRLDSIATQLRKDSFYIKDEKLSFGDVATFISDDKDTRNNKGLMAFVDPMTGSLSSRFQMKDLPTEVARVVEGMKVGDVSKPFRMINKRGKTVCAFIRLRNRIDGHRATITEDYQVMQNIVLAKERQDFIHNWVVNKIKKTYVRMKDRYKTGEYEYEGWVR